MIHNNFGVYQFQCERYNKISRLDFIHILMKKHNFLFMIRIPSDMKVSFQKLCQIVMLI